MFNAGMSTTDPPSKTAALFTRISTFHVVELVSEVALRSESPAERDSVLRVVEQLAQTDQGRQTIDRVLTPGFIRSLTAVTGHPRPAFPPRPTIKLYQNPTPPYTGIQAWIDVDEDEEPWPVAFLQAVQIDQAISAVWEDNVRPFVELFLFDGTDLQGRFVRYARVQSDVKELVTVLDPPPGLSKQARSLLGSSRSIPGRRFSAEHELSVPVSVTFDQWRSEDFTHQYGTASLVEPPKFSWDGYDTWMNSGYSPLPKTAALRIQLVIRIDDVLYGTTTVSAHFDTILQRTGGTNPVAWAYGTGGWGVPPPWDGTSANMRWGVGLDDLLGFLNTLVAQQVGLLAGPSPGSVRILPGRSTQVPTPTNIGISQIGRTDDDSTIVLSP
jgi:hypothetical protein